MSALEDTTNRLGKAEAMNLPEALAVISETVWWVTLVDGTPGPDAESAARAVQSGRATGTPKSRDAQVEMIRVLQVARRGAMKGRIQAGAQIDALILTAPEPVRAPLRKLSFRRSRWHLDPGRLQLTWGPPQRRS
jgi:hypothetical protein